MTRIVDSREAPERRDPLVAAGFTAKRLDAGDVQFTGAGGAVIGIEHKRLYQALADMASGQLIRQCRRLIEEVDHPWLLLQGQFWTVDGRFADFPRYTALQLRNQLATLQDLGMRWERVEDAAGAVQRTLELYDYYNRTVHHSVRRQVAGDPRVVALSGIYGVDAGKAEAILSVLPTLEAVATATPEQLQVASGIGPKLAQRIYAYWRWTPSKKG